MWLLHMYFLNCQIFDKAKINIFFQGQLYGDLKFSSWASSLVLHESLWGRHSTLAQMKEILTAAWASSWAGSSARPFRKTDESRDWSHCLSVRGVVQSASRGPHTRLGSRNQPRLRWTWSWPSRTIWLQPAVRVSSPSRTTKLWRCL